MKLTRRLSAAIGIVTLTVAVTACGAIEHQTVQSTSKASENVDAAAVARDYLEALFAGKLGEANEFVAPSSQGVLKAIALSAKNSETSVSGLDIGDVTLSDGRASVVFLGKICPTASKDADQCVVNEDPSSKNPAFIVDLAKLSGDWKVVFNKPSGTQSTSTSESTSDGSSTSDESGPASSDDGEGVSDEGESTMN